MAVKPLFLLNILVYIGFLTTLYYIIFSNRFTQDIAPVETTTEYNSEDEAWDLIPTQVPSIMSVLKTAPPGKQKDVGPGPQNISEVKTYGELSTLFCLKGEKLPEDAIKPALTRKPCPRGIVTIYPGGRTGNCMWEYSGVLAISLITQLKPYVAACLKYKLELAFGNLTIPTFEEIAHCPFNFSETVDSLEKYNNSTNQSIIVPKFNFLSTLVIPRLSKIEEEFSFRIQLKDKAQQTLRRIVKTYESNSEEYTFVGVHVRRTDYIRYLKKKYNMTPIPNQFLEDAMTHYKSKYKNCLFVYVSDDPTWCFEQFGSLVDVAVPSYNTTSTPAEDLALLAACNHTIIDYGTFGEWGALLAGGDVVYSRTAGLNPGKCKLNNWMKIS